MTILDKLIALEREAENFGFRWNHTDQIMNQIKSECIEISAHLNQPHDEEKIKLQEEIGDLLHAVFSLCIFCQFDPRDTLEKSINKFENRFTAVKHLANQQGLTTLKGKSFEEFMQLWDKVKQDEK